ncbi:hypothetical protein KUCAC02_026404, partial [Chaenocephalus aceratus]
CLVYALQRDTDVMMKESQAQMSGTVQNNTLPSFPLFLSPLLFSANLKYRRALDVPRGPRLPAKACPHASPRALP